MRNRRRDANTSFWQPVQREEHKTLLRSEFIPGSFSQTQHRWLPRSRSMPGQSAEEMQALHSRGGLATVPDLPLFKPVRMPFNRAPDVEANRNFCKTLYANARNCDLQPDNGALPCNLFLPEPPPPGWERGMKRGKDSMIFPEELGAPLTKQELVYKTRSGHDAYQRHDIPSGKAWWGGISQDKVEPHMCSGGLEHVKVFNLKTVPTETQQRIDFPNDDPDVNKPCPPGPIEWVNPYKGCETWIKRVNTQTKMGMMSG